MKQVSAHSTQVCCTGGPSGTNVWNTFVPRVEHPYIVGKSVKSLDMGKPTFHVERTACY